MDLLQLKYFCHAAATQNFSQTAREFNVPTSNISQCIKRLEGELGVSLFIRSANRLQLSPQGELFYKGVQNALDTLDSTLFAVSSSVSKESICVAACLHRQNITRAISRFHAKYPSIDVTCERPNAPAITSSLADCSKYDLIVACDNIHAPDFEESQITCRKLLLFAPKGYLPKNLSTEVLAHQTFISLPYGSYMYSNTQWLFQSLNIAPPLLAQDTHSIYFVPRCLEERRGVAFAPSFVKWAVHMHEFLDVFDVGEFYRTVYLYRRKDSISPYVSSLYDFIVSEQGPADLLISDTFPHLIKANLTPLPDPSQHVYPAQTTCI